MFISQNPYALYDDYGNQVFLPESAEEIELLIEQLEFLLKEINESN